MAEYFYISREKNLPAVAHRYRQKIDTNRKETKLMKCPVCGKEMEKGGTSHLMRSDFGEKIFWAPDEFFEKTHIPVKRTVEKAGGKVFSIGRSIFDNEPRYSWYCRGCEIVVIDAKEKH
ncbi:MAG: hypothetical protein HDT24_04735 [Ruminococcus sp.]|nr:hypothetical protein [Ruminococcus sp.]